MVASRPLRILTKVFDGHYWLLPLLPQGIRISQRLAVAIHFTPLMNNPAKQTRELKIATDATLSSCWCMLELLQLPAYQRSRDESELDHSQIGYCAECLVSRDKHCASSFVL